MATEFVPQVSSLEQIYSAAQIPTEEKRWRKLDEVFQGHYGQSPAFVARCPGRVNIIGEHIDYMLYDVLPMAVAADVLIAVSITPSPVSRVRLRNLDEARFPAREFSIDRRCPGNVDVDAKHLDWSDYFRAGLKGALQIARLPEGQLASMDVLVDGTIPAGSGLSSSAAFVCSSLLAAAIANGAVGVEKGTLASMAADSERSVGLNTGGMDHAASVFGRPGYALNIGFVPELTVRPIAFPQTGVRPVFVIANTLVTSVKRVTAPLRYNLRVVETSMASDILAKTCGILPLVKNGGTLRGFQDAYIKQRATATGSTSLVSSQQEKDQRTEDGDSLRAEISAVLDFAKNTFTRRDGYTLQQVAELLELSEEEVVQRYMTRYPVRAQTFHLYKRVLHVLSEAIRVRDFAALLSAHATVTEDFLVQIGAKMNESQASCRDLYDCSCPEIEQMCALAREAGSYGSRLSGAGWGGCTIHLSTPDRVQTLIQALKQSYYHPRKLSDREVEMALLVTEPGSGAMVFKAVTH